MAEPRSAYDEATGTYLLYPDVLVIDNVKKTNANQRDYIAFTASLDVLKEDLGKYEKSRRLRVNDARLILRKPEADTRVLDFDFVQAQGLAGSAVVTCVLGTADAVLNAISSDATYFKPEYRGTSEEFSSWIDIAHFLVTQTVADVVGGESSKIGLGSAIFVLRSLIEQTTGSNNATELLLNACLNQTARVIETTNDGKRALAVELTVSPLPTNIKIRDLQERVIAILGAPANIRVVVRQ